MRCLVLGGCGFLGSHLVDGLLNKGYEIVVFDKVDVDTKNINHNLNKIDLIEGDFTNKNDLERTIRDIDDIFHARHSEPVDVIILIVIVSVLLAIHPAMQESTLDVRNDTLKRKLNLFGSGTKCDGLFKIGPHNDLVDRSISMIDMMEGNATVELDQAINYADVDPNASFTNSDISGRVFLSGNNGTNLNLAVGINGTIRAVTRTLPLEGGIGEGSAMVQETSFRPGENHVEVFVVSQVGAQLCLERIRSKSKVSYSLATSTEKSGETITSSNGKSIPVIPNALKGHLDVADVGSDRIVLSGWVADVENSQLPEAIVIFMNGKFFYSGYCEVDRPDVVKAYDNAALQRAGFRYLFPLSLLKNIANSEVRIFAVSKEGVASELIYPKGYTLGKSS